MASLTKKSTSPYFFACFRDHTGTQCRRSTFETDAVRAQEIADTLEAIVTRKLGARKLRKTMRDLYQKMYGEDEEFQSATIKDYCARWLREKKRTVAPGSYQSYEHAVSKFLSFLSNRAGL